MITKKYKTKNGNEEEKEEKIVMFLRLIKNWEEDGELL